MKHFTGATLTLRTKLIFVLVLVGLCVPVRAIAARQQDSSNADLTEAVIAYLHAMKKGDYFCITVPVPGYHTLQEISDELTDSGFDETKWISFKQCAEEIHGYPRPSNFTSYSQVYIAYIDELLMDAVPDAEETDDASPLTDAIPETLFSEEYSEPIADESTPEAEFSIFEKFREWGATLVEKVVEKVMDNVLDQVDNVIDGFSSGMHTASL